MATLMERGARTRRAQAETTEVITPERAAYWLADHDEAVERGAIRRNRKIRPQKVAEYAADMAAGLWVLNGEAIMFDTDDLLMGGEHRLRACLEAGVPFESRVLRGLDRALRDTLDAGVPRSAKDVIYEMGCSDPNTVQSVISYVIAYDRAGVLHPGLLPVHQRATRREIIEAYDQIGAEIEGLVGYHRAPHIRRSLAAAIRFIASQQGLGEEADEFFRLVATGDGIGQGHPAFALRKRLVEFKMSKRAKPTPALVSALYVKAFNAYVRGERMEMLRFRIGGPGAEAFPTIAAAEEVS